MLSKCGPRAPSGGGEIPAWEEKRSGTGPSALEYGKPRKKRGEPKKKTVEKDVAQGFKKRGGKAKSRGQISSPSRKKQSLPLCRGPRRGGKGKENAPIAEGPSPSKVLP